ncbi:roadblock/LC7 domain-containing protein [Saccharopolyspora sp. NPDC000995]
MTAQEMISRRFGWLITDFTERVAGVAHTIVVSADGLVLTASATLPRDRADQLAAVASGLLSLTQGSAKCFEAGRVVQTIVEMQHGTLLQMGISDGSCLTVLAAPQCDMGLVAYEMTMLVERVGQMLTPEIRSKLQATPNAFTGQLV